MKRSWAVAVLAAWCWAAPASAEVAVEARTPLVVVRFNQRNVYFERALYDAVQRAVAAKADVAFDVVLHPGSRDGRQESLNRVTAALRDMGVPAERIASVVGNNAGDRNDEVFVYVR